MVNFGRAIRVQSNPSWIDEYVQYRRLKTIIKRLVFIWTHGKLHEIPMRYDPDNPSLALEGPQLIPPKMPTDDSDDEDELEDTAHVSIASISVRPSLRRADMSKASRDRQRVQNELSEGVRELAELEASEKQHQAQNQNLQSFAHSEQGDSTPSTPLLSGPELSTPASSTAGVETLSLHTQRYGALDTISQSPLSPVDLPPPSHVRSGYKEHLTSRLPPTGSSTTSTQSKGLAKVLSFASFKSLFASAGHEDTGVTPASTPHVGPTATTSHTSSKSRKQQQAKLIFEQYQNDFWTILNEDFARIEKFYDANVSRCTVAVHHMVQDAVGSYRHRAPGMEAAANAGLTRDEARFGAILAIYEQLIDLKAYCQLNVQGFRKILKKYEKYSPKIQRDVGQIVSVTAQPCAKFMQRVRNSSFALMEDLQLLIQQISNLVSRDKLLAIELQVQAKRNDNTSATGPGQLHAGNAGPASYRFGPCKLIPFTIAVALFFLILMLPLNLDPARYQVAPHTATLDHASAPSSSGSTSPVLLDTTSPTLVSRTVKILRTPSPPPTTPTPTPIPTTTSTGTASLPPPPDTAHDSYIAHRAHCCFAVLVLAITLWVTEAIPYFCTGLLIPILVVLLDLAVDPAVGSVRSLAPKQAANYVSSKMFDHTSLLVLLGFAISAAFSKAQFELRIASKFQAKLGSKPRLFILGIMVLGLVLSMWLGNHTAPILCVAFLLPVMQDYKHDSKFNRALMLGLTFACNIGGMTTPIASLQNIVAVATLSKVGIDISFGQWLAVSVPLCFALVLICWGYIMFTIDPDDVDSIPLIAYDKRPLTSLHWLVMSLSAITVILLAVPSLTESTLGGIPTVSLIYLVTLFSTGVLTTVDINSFNWHLILLIGGGSVLGDVIKSSKLLDVLSSVILSTLSSHPIIAYFEIVFVIIVITSCISHTVGALILTPLIVKLGISLGIPVALTLTCAFAISGAMALPFSSFPNLNSAMARDESGHQYLDSHTIMRAGIPFTLITYAFLVTVGYGLIRVILGS